MPVLKGNLHAHTTMSDGSRSLDEVIVRYGSLGYDFLAITDHAEQVPANYWRRIPASGSGLLIFRGVEIGWPGLGQHVGMILGDAERLYVLNHPGRYGLSVCDTLERIHVLRGEGFAVHAVEVTEGGTYQPQYDVDGIPFVKIATDDTHRDHHFGRAWVEVSAPRNRDAILRAIRAGEFRMGFRSDDDTTRQPDSTAGWWKRTTRACRGHLLRRYGDS